jgi:serine/threonine protein phosphatase PrpC
MFHKQAMPKLADVAGFLQAAMLAAHEQLLNYAAMHGMDQSPSSTLVLSVLQDNHCYTAHCGDSRRYLVRAGAVFSRTVDHSVAEWKDSVLVANGGTPVSKHMLYSCLGAPKRPVIEMGPPIEMQVGDRLLLCSDGLWGNVDQDDIVYNLTALALTEATQALADLALERGGAHCDNVTLISVSWEKADNPTPD